MKTIDNTHGSLPRSGYLLELIAQIRPTIGHRLTVAQSSLDHSHDRSYVFESAIVSIIAR